MATSGTELFLIRHAPAAAEGRLCGRTDVPAQASPLAGLDRLRNALASVRRRVCSPALRCRQTAEALWPEGVKIDARLQEQDFGLWDGLPVADVPDLGLLPPADLAAHRPPGGESFDDLCRRVWPALRELAATGEPTAIIAHAGTVRAAIALALGATGPALSFEVVPLSLTRVRHLPPDSFSVACVNCPAG